MEYSLLVLPSFYRWKKWRSSYATFPRSHRQKVPVPDNSPGLSDFYAHTLNISSMPTLYDLSSPNIPCTMPLLIFCWNWTLDIIYLDISIMQLRTFTWRGQLNLSRSHIRTFSPQMAPLLSYISKPYTAFSTHPNPSPHLPKHSLSSSVLSGLAFLWNTYHFLLVPHTWHFHIDCLGISLIAMWLI